MSYYQRHIFFCVNERADGRASCQDHCASEMRDYAKQRVKVLGLSGKGQVRVNNAGCLDRCGKGPVAVVYPEAVWYSYQSKADIDEIIESHLRDGEVVERLQI